MEELVGRKKYIYEVRYSRIFGRMLNGYNTSVALRKPIRGRILGEFRITRI